MQNIKKPEGKAGEEILNNMNKNHTPIALWALKHTPIKGEDIVIDIGCGGGINLQRYSKIAKDGKIIGVDYSSTSVKKSIDFNQKEVDSGKIEVIKADVVDVPLDDGTADVITASATIYYWPDIIKAFKEIKRLLKKDGKFVIIQGANGYTDELIELKKEVELNAYDEYEFKDFLFKVGFKKVVSIIRNIPDNVEITKTYIGEEVTISQKEDTFDMVNPDDEHHNSHEWLCVVAYK